MICKTNLNLLIRVEKCEYNLKPLFIGTYVSVQYVIIFLYAPVRMLVRLTDLILCTLARIVVSQKLPQTHRERNNSCTIKMPRLAVHHISTKFRRQILKIRIYLCTPCFGIFIFIATPLFRAFILSIL